MTCARWTALASSSSLSVAAKWTSVTGTVVHGMPDLGDVPWVDAPYVLRLEPLGVPRRRRHHLGLWPARAFEGGQQVPRGLVVEHAIGGFDRGHVVRLATPRPVAGPVDARVLGDQQPFADAIPDLGARWVGRHELRAGDDSMRGGGELGDDFFRCSGLGVHTTPNPGQLRHSPPLRAPSAAASPAPRSPPGPAPNAARRPAPAHRIRGAPCGTCRPPGAPAP